MRRREEPRIARLEPRVFRPGVILLALAMLPGCGYALAGRINALPPHIKIIGVPPFVNQTPYPDLDIKFAEAVRAEFRSRGHFQVRPDDQSVDAVFTGRVTNAQLAQTVFNSSGQAERNTITVTLAIEFKDVRDNAVLYAQPASADENYPVTAGATQDLGAFFRQNTGALDRLAQKLARSVVTAILTRF